ncbi:MAG: SPFH domain-containing protein [Clostridia bacterium]|nr:SPFH domain-containing protein [Clostridia bacterium]
MGLFQAVSASVRGALGDAWKEAFFCDALPAELLLVRGRKRTAAASSNQGSDEIITDGSIVSVADGQCAIVTDMGKAVDVCDQPGEHVYSRSGATQFLSGLAQDVRRRVAFGGDAPVVQRVYYLNTKECLDNPFQGAAVGRVRDGSIGYDADVGVEFAGVYSYRITDPLLFFNTMPRGGDRIERATLAPQLTAEFVQVLQTVLSDRLSDGMRPSEFPALVPTLCAEITAQLNAQQAGMRGLTIESVALTYLRLTDADAARLTQLQATAVLRDPAMAGAALASAQADAMRTAAANPGGGGVAAAAFVNPFDRMAASIRQREEERALNLNEKWKCPDCGCVNDSPFCGTCGAKRPEEMT